MARASVTSFREKLQKGSVYGPFMKTCDSAFAEAAGYAGFDYCILDMEHGPVGTERLKELIQACECGGILPIVRVPDISEESIGKPLDLGAGGVQVPQVSCARDAQRVVELAKFHPEGTRGVCRYVRAARYSLMDKFDYFQEANESVVILQVEGMEGVKNIDEILTVKGIDVIFIGPYDLSQSLGVTGDVENPLVTDTMVKLVQKAKEHGVTVGTFVDSVEAGCRWRKLGVRYLSYSVDVGIFSAACRQAVDAFHAEER